MTNNLFTPTRYCSVNTELICRVNRAKYELCIRRCRSKMNRVSFTFSLQDSSLKRTDTSEYRMSTSFEVFDHEIGDFILFSISLVGVRFLLLQDPGMTSVLAETSLRSLIHSRNSKHGLKNFPFIVQSISLNIDMKRSLPSNCYGFIFRTFRSSWTF